MANNPSTLPGYNGQTAAPDASYPYGSARNDVSPGDLSGTPRIAAEINDIMGFQQALLDEASIVPSGSPDTALVSQYLQALKLVAKKDMIGFFDTLANIVASTSPDRVQEGGIIFAGDRSDAPFSVVTLASLGGGVLNDANEINLVGFPLLALDLNIKGDIDSSAFGIVYGDASDQTLAIEIAITLLSPLGFYLIISGVVKANISSTDENIRIKGGGELQPFTRTSPTLVATSTFNAATAITAIATVTATISARTDATVSKVTSPGHTIIIGDVVKVVSEDVIPTTLISQGCRNGEWGVVLDISGDDIFLSDVLEETYTTTPRIASITDRVCDIQIKIKSTTGNGSVSSALAIINGYYRPELNLNLSENDGVGLVTHGCYQAQGNIIVKNLTDDVGNSIFGYGVIESGSGLSNLIITQSGCVRHAYTTGVASPSDTAIHTYGETWACNIKGVSHGATSNAWDTHSQGNGIIFDHVQAYDCQSMFQSRSRGTRAIHPTGSDMLFLAQVRNDDTGTKAELEITGYRIERAKKPFNLKDDSASSNAPTLIVRGDNFISYEPTVVSAAIDSQGNISFYGSSTFKMLGGTDNNVWAQSIGDANVYGQIIFDTSAGVCTKPFKINDSDFTIHSEQGGAILIKSAAISKLFTANDAPAASTSNIKANNIETNIALTAINNFEFTMATEQITIKSSASQTTQSSFQFINTSGGNTDIVFDSLDAVIYLQFSTDAGNDTITSISDGNFPGQKLFIDNGVGSTLNIPDSLSNVEYTHTIALDNTDELTWRGTYWA